MVIIAKREESEGNGDRVSAGVEMGVESRRGESTDLEYVTHSTYREVFPPKPLICFSQRRSRSASPSSSDSSSSSDEESQDGHTSHKGTSSSRRHRSGSRECTGKEKKSEKKDKDRKRKKDKRKNREGEVKRSILTGKKVGVRKRHNQVTIR